MRLLLFLLFEWDGKENEGKSYYDLLQAFDIHDTMKNEPFIEKCCKRL